MTSPDERNVSQPVLGRERGTIFDYLGGVVSTVDVNHGEIIDPSEPTVIELQEMLDRDGKAASLERVLALPIQSAEWTIKPVDSDKVNDTVMKALSLPVTEGGMQTPMDLVLAQMTSAFVVRRAHF